MEDLSNMLSNSLQCFIYDYDPSLGIRHSAEVLANLLIDLNDLSKTSDTPDGVLAENELYLVGHSMGGLVGKYLVLKTEAGSFFDRYVSLASPHAGAVNEGHVRAIIRAVETLSRNRPTFSSKKRSTAIAELTGSDKDKILASLNKMPFKIPAVSYSAGLNQLGSRALDLLLRTILSRPNDGIVEENSASLVSSCKGSQNLGHINDYVEFSQVNHYEIHKNHSVQLSVIKQLVL